MAEPLRLLVVCLGNICRSPMAEGALRARIAEASLGHRAQVDSVGTGNWHVGHPPDTRAIATARRHGVDLSGLRARQLGIGDFHANDWLLCADASNLHDVRTLAPVDGRARVALLSEWAGLAGDVPDPYTGDRDDFERVWAQLDAIARAAVARLRDGGAD